MRYRLTVTAAVLSAAAMLLSGCAGSGDTRSAPSVTSPAASSAPARPAQAPPSQSDPGPPPAPQALTDVMYRLADPAVPGADKLPLLQDSAPTDAVTLDQFAAGLRDGGFSPVAFTATDVHWAGDEPGNALATVTVTTTNPTNPGPFSFPMEFHTGPAGWQLTRETAEMVLAFGNARTALPAR